MKNLILILSLLTSSLFAQTGINYQGAATDADGAKLVNQNISLKTSVLQGGVDGITSYSETHNTTTDQFGLFNVVIGQGVSISGDFETISWGSGDHFLKVELDATGGTNYNLVSTTQMMSVPYALYAKNAALDSTNLANMLASMNISENNTGGCDLKFPDGLMGEPITHYLSTSSNDSYTVEAGKNLYITNLYTDQYYEIKIDGITITEALFNKYSGSDLFGNTLANPLILKENQTISIVGSFGAFNGFLVTPKVEPVTHYLSPSLNDSYTVETGKNLYITNLYTDEYYEIKIDGITITEALFNKYAGSDLFGNTLSLPLIVKAGQSISMNGGYGSFNGYLVNEDYFVDCGGVGGSANSSPSGVDSAMVAEMIASINPSGSVMTGCDIKYPEGIGNEFITMTVTDTDTYSVPANKRLYITNAYCYNSSLDIDDIPFVVNSNNSESYSLSNPIIVSEGQTVSSSSNYPANINGFLVELNSDITAITHYTNSSNNYVVPQNKSLFITNVYCSNSSLDIDGVSIVVNSNAAGGYSLGNIIVAQEGQVLSTVNNYPACINGYLVDEDYFENCGGGGGSVSSSNSGVDSAMVAEMINELATAQNFGLNSSNLTFGEFEDITDAVNENLTSVGGSLNYQQNEDGFLYFHLNSTNTGLFQIEVDSVPITSIAEYYNPHGRQTLLLPVKKDYYWSVAADYPAVSKAYWIKFDNNSDDISTSNIDSVMVADMISSALSTQGNSSIPTGTVQAFAGEIIPDGWMLCDGSAISRTDYHDLFEVIGEKYGTGDGTFTMEWSDTNGDGNMQQDEFTNIPSTFNIPDLRGRVIIGPDNMGGNNAGVVQNLNDVGVTGGLETHTLTEAEMPSHEHDLWPVTLGGAVGGGGPGGTNTSGSWQSPGYGTILSQQAGGDQPHNNMQPYISINYIIKL